MKKVDVRLLLVVLGFLLAAIAGDPLATFDVIQGMFSEGGIIGPICSAMGYAYVLRITECDKHMVLLLTRPLKNMGWLLIPGGAVAGFITNMAITSQTASAAALGPILFPILRAAGHSRITSAATILVGCSVGGNLFNPGEPDIVAIASATNIASASVISATVVPNIIALVAAVVTLMLLSGRAQEHPTSQLEDIAVSSLKAAMGPLPVVLLLLLQPSLNIVPPLSERYPFGVHVSLVMVACTAVVIVVTTQHWRSAIAHASAISVQFFEGMGYAFANVISIIIAASCFIAGLKAVGIVGAITGALQDSAGVATAVAPAITWLMAAVGGSGTAPSVAFTKAMLPTVAHTNPVGAVDLGVSAAIGANVGRTMSPVAAVVLFTSALAEISVPALIRRVAPCMVAAVAATILFGLIFR